MEFNIATIKDRTLTSTVTASTPAATQGNVSARDAFQRVSTAIYGQLLVLLGLLVPLSHSGSDADLETSSYVDLFYIFLLLVSVLFLIFVFIDLVGSRTQESLVMRRRRRSVEKVKTVLKVLTMIVHVDRVKMIDIVEDPKDDS